MTTDVKHHDYIPPPLTSELCWFFLTWYLKKVKDNSKSSINLVWLKCLKSNCVWNLYLSLKYYLHKLDKTFWNDTNVNHFSRNAFTETVKMQPWHNNKKITKLSSCSTAIALTTQIQNYVILIISQNSYNNNFNQTIWWCL